MRASPLPTTIPPARARLRIHRSFTLPRHTWERLRAEAAMRGQSFSALLSRISKEWCDANTGEIAEALAMTRLQDESPNASVPDDTGDEDSGDIDNGSKDTDNGSLTHGG